MDRRGSESPLETDRVEVAFTYAEAAFAVTMILEGDHEDRPAGDRAMIAELRERFFQALGLGAA